MKQLMLGFVMTVGVCFGAPQSMSGGVQSAPQRERVSQSSNDRGTARPMSRQRSASGERRSGQSHDRSADSGELSESEQKLVEQLEEANSMKAIERLSQRAASSRRVEVRQAMVEALGKRGEDALDYLAAYIADTDKEVADSAFAAWVEILNDMDHNERVMAIKSAAAALGSGASRHMQDDDRVSGGAKQRRGWLQNESPAHGSGERTR